MTTSVLDSLREQRSVLESEIEGLFSADDFDPSDDTFVRAKGEAEKIDARIAAIVEHGQRKSAANAIDALSVRARQSQDARKATEDEHRSLGEAWVRSKVYTDYLSAPRGTSGHVGFDAERLFRAPILSEDFGGATANVFRPGTVADVYDRNPSTPLLDLIPRIPVSSGSVEWVVYPVAPVADVVAEGALKPEATVAPTLANLTLQIVAHWIQYSRSVMEDQGALMRYIDSSLRQGVTQKVEAEAAAVLVGATLPSTTYSTGGGQTLLHGIRHAIADVQEAGYYPNAVVLNPADYADLDLGLLGQTVVNTGTGPQIGQTYWGVRPVPSSAVTVGEAYLGDFSTGMANLVRSEVQVYTTDSHASTFTSNVLTTLAEVRAKAVVHQPNALTKISAVA